jgi:signal transduction histidine kinase
MKISPIHSRINLLLYITGLFFLLMLVFLYLTTLHQEKLIQQATHDQLQNENRSMVENKTELLIQVAYDYTFWDDFVEHLTPHDSDWYENNITTILKSFKIDYVAVYDSSFNLVHEASSADRKYSSNITVEILQKLKEKKFLNFFHKTPEGLFEISAATVHPEMDPNHMLTRPMGFVDQKKELLVAKLKAEESDMLKTAFLANMSHEIRTPMNGILGFVELLKEPKLSGEEQQEYIGIIAESGQRMLNIINDIISISKLEAGHTEVVITETNVNDQVRYIFTFFKPEAEKRGVEFNYKHGLPDLSSHILTDREKLYAILSNLVKNAVKFTHQGSIELGYEKKGRFLEFYVKDTGVGIRQDQQEIVFERFRQASESLSRNYEGAGLGLAISKAYVEILGGKIWLESELDKGSAFYFTIPFDPVNIAGNNVVSEKYSTWESLNVNGLKILVAEDDPISDLFLRKLIRSFAKEVLKVGTGDEAVEVCRQNPDIDLILMDIQMPGMDGYEATRQIRQFNTKVVILAQTALALKGEKEIAMEAGCNDYLPKPISLGDFSRLIRKYFEEQV